MLTDRDVMTLAEAADYLRMSRSTLYQRPDIPRHRLPGSRGFRFLKEELLAWLKSGPNEQTKDGTTDKPVRILDIATRPVYHRNPRYR